MSTTMAPCSECGHEHFNTERREYDECPLRGEGCPCRYVAGTARDLGAEEDEVQFEDCKGHQGGCGSPSCLSCNPPEPCCYVSFQTRGAQHHVTCEEY